VIQSSVRLSPHLSAHWLTWAIALAGFWEAKTPEPVRRGDQRADFSAASWPGGLVPKQSVVVITSSRPKEPV
jgi:hypothetical protein